MTKDQLLSLAGPAIAAARAASRRDTRPSAVASSRPTWDVIQGTDGREIIALYARIYAADNLGSGCSREEFLLEVVYRKLKRVIPVV
jgi:hypothetical protein